MRGEVAADIFGGVKNGDADLRLSSTVGDFTKTNPSSSSPSANDLDFEASRVLATNGSNDVYVDFEGDARPSISKSSGSNGFFDEKGERAKASAAFRLSVLCRGIVGAFDELRVGVVGAMSGWLSWPSLCR
jgi:hypothetical protein